MLWKLRVATTGFGHFLALLPLLTLLLVRHSTAAVVLCLLASLLLLSTLPRAARASRSLPAQIDAAFPAAHQPRGAAGAPAPGEGPARRIGAELRAAPALGDPRLRGRAGS